MAKPRKKQEKIGIDSVNQTNTTAIVLGVGAVIVVIALIAIIFAVTNKSDSNTNDDVVQFRPVTVDGAALPPEYADANSQQVNEAVGTQAPDIHGSSFDGSAVNITKDGKAKVLVFVAHWCPHCRNEVPLLADWIPANKSKYPNVEFITIATASDPSKANYPPSAWLKRENWPTPVIADDNTFTAANSYGLGAYPYIVALDGDNKVVTRNSGELTMADFASLTQRAEDAADKKPATTTPSTATTAPAAQTRTDESTTTAAP